MAHASNKNANYRKNNDRSISSGKYHKLDGTPQRAILKEDTRKEMKENADEEFSEEVKIK